MTRRSNPPNEIEAVNATPAELEMAIEFGRPIESSPRGDRWATWLTALRRRSGVYFIRYRGHTTPVYVGHNRTNNLVKTITRHFQEWTGPTAGTIFDRYDVEIAVIVAAPSDVMAVERAMILHLMPEANTYGKGDDSDAYENGQEDSGFTPDPSDEPIPF